MRGGGQSFERCNPMGGGDQNFEMGEQVEEGQSLLLRRVNSAR